MPQSYPADVYAAHVVAAAVYAAFGKGSSPSKLFPRMLSALKTMHDTNPAWGPLYVVNRGDVQPDMAMDRIGDTAPQRATKAAPPRKRR
jgi:hypothetical protein